MTHLNSIIVFIIWFTCASSIPMIRYENAQFEPTDSRYWIKNLYSIDSREECSCRCYSNERCVTGMFYHLNQTCSLYFAHLWQGVLKFAAYNRTSVFSFPNRTIIYDMNNPPAIIQWLFDGNFNDAYGRFNGYPTDNNDISWVEPGYSGRGKAVHFGLKSSAVINEYLNLTNTNFTVSAWIWIPMSTILTSGEIIFGLFSHCEITYIDRCLHLTLMNHEPHMGFYSDDLRYYKTLDIERWHHVAYVYDRSNKHKSIYLNGNLCAQQSNSGNYLGNTTELMIGTIKKINWSDYENGYIDKLTFVSRVKSDRELLDEACLVAYYSFDNSYLDNGTNEINDIVAMNTNFDSNGLFNQSLILNSSNMTYFQTTGFYYLGLTNYSYSFSMWIYPFQFNGTLLQVTSLNGWCLPMIGFNDKGQLTIQTLGSSSIYKAFTNKLLKTNTWTHVTMTYSTQNGIRLFINGTLANATKSTCDYLPNGRMMTIIIGTGLYPVSCSLNTTSNILKSQYFGKIDELRIYSRELLQTDINELSSV